MSKARQDFVIDAYKGKTLRFTVSNVQFTLVDGLTWRLAPTPDGVVIVQKTLVAGIVIVDDETIDITISDEEIADPGLYFHVLYQTISGTDTMLARGRGFVRPLPAAPA